MRKEQRWILLGSLFLLSFLWVGCAAGDPLFSAKAPANFWFGLWHGAIVGVSFIISLFSDNVTIYEVHNVGAWYNFGFLLGVISFWGGSGAKWKSAERRRRDEEWAELGGKLERKILDEMREWVEDESEHHDEEWKDVEKKVVAKLKRKMKEWAEED